MQPGRGHPAQGHRVWTLALVYLSLFKKKKDKEKLETDHNNLYLANTRKTGKNT